MDIAAFVTVICTTSVSLYSLYCNQVSKYKMQKLAQEHEKEMLDMKRQHESREKMLPVQTELLAQMAPLLIEMSQTNYESRFKLLALSYMLTANSEYDSYEWNAAHALSAALTRNFEKRDTIGWLSILDNCANGIHPGQASVATAGKDQTPSTSESPKKPQRWIVRVAKAIRSGWRAFRDSMLSEKY